MFMMKIMIYFVSFSLWKILNKHSLYCKMIERATSSVDLRQLIPCAFPFNRPFNYVQTLTLTTTTYLAVISEFPGSQMVTFTFACHVQNC